MPTFDDSISNKFLNIVIKVFLKEVVNMVLQLPPVDDVPVPKGAEVVLGK